jgi:hypothetical protein
MNDFDARVATWDDDPAEVERAQAVAANDAATHTVKVDSGPRRYPAFLMVARKA